MNTLLHRIGSDEFSKAALAIEISSETEIDLSKICRTCLRETEDNDLGNEALCIISSSGKLVRLYEMFEAATGLKITSNDTLPHHICSPCLQIVNSSYSFRVQSEKAYHILQTVLSSLKDDDQSGSAQNTVFKVELQEEEQEEEDVAQHQEQTQGKQIPDKKAKPDEQQLQIKTQPKKEPFEVELEPDDDEQEEQPEPDEEQLEPNDEQPEPDEEQPEPGEELPEEISYDELSVEEASLDNIQDAFADEDVIMDIEQLDELFEHENFEGNTVLEKNIESVKVFQKSKNPSLFRCDFCSFVFPLQRDIIQHYKDEHPDEKPFKCEVCSVTFVHIQSMRRHKKTHAACPKKKKCPLCNKLFHRSDDLTRHIRTHTNERPYACSICQKAFKQHTELKDHMLSHEDSKMYKCDPCRKEWRSRNGWYLHMKAHQEGREGRRKQTMRKFKGTVPEMEA